MQDKTIAANGSTTTHAWLVLVSFLLLSLGSIAFLAINHSQEQVSPSEEAKTFVAPKGPEVLSQAICANYSVSCKQARETLKVVMDEAVRHDVGVALAVGLALHESGFRTDAKSNTGDHGLLQVNYRWHKDKVRALRDLYDPRVNTRIGLSYLKTLLERKGNVRLALRHYNGANARTPYPDEVLKKANWAAQFI